MYRGTTKITAAIAIGLASLAMTGCAAEDASTDGGGDGPIKIGSALDLTAYLASFDRGVRDGVDLAVKRLNADGGVLDRKLEAVVDDMKADPQQGVRSVQKLIDQDQVVAFASGFSSAATQAEAPQAESTKRPMVVASVIPDKSTWQFSTVPAPAFETGIRVRYLVEKKISSIAVLSDSTPYNEKQLVALKGQAKEAGIRITEVVKHKSDAVDLRAQVTRLLRTKPGAIVKLSAGPTHIVAAKALAAAGSRIPLLLSIEAFTTMQKAAAAYPETFFAAAPPQVFDAMTDAERSAPLKALVAAAPKGQDLTYVGRGYDAVLLLGEAIKKAGSTDGEKVRQALVDLGPFSGTSGVYDFTADNHYGITTNPLYLARVQGSAAQIVLRPETSGK
jgi:branched-chain amino acid transport system substrate-binding protein